MDFGLLELTMSLRERRRSRNVKEYYDADEEGLEHDIDDGRGRTK